MEGAYSIITDMYAFAMTISKYETFYTIRFGDAYNRTGPCMEFTYDVNNASIIKLDNLEYRSSCANGDILLRGKGTIHMVQCALKHILTIFPKIKRVHLQDATHIECNGHQLPLLYIYVLCHGQTWYAKHFQAKPIKKSLADRLQDITTLLSSKPSAHLGASFKGSEGFPSWQAYFQSHKHSCKFFWDKLLEIKDLLRVPLLYSEWYIPRKAITSYDINILDIVKMQRGGVPNWYIRNGHKI